MNPQAEELNQIIRRKNPAVYEMLSEKGKAIFFPNKGILGQTAEAKATRINATIGTAVEDDGTPMRLKSIAEKVNLNPSQVFPYAPSYGRPDLREQWRKMIIKKNPSIQNMDISLPVVSQALTHGMSMAGYMFIDPGDEVILPDLYWGNYNLILSAAYDAKLVKFNLFKNGQFDLEALEAQLNAGLIGKKILLLNFPNNPSGYTPSQAEVDGIVKVIADSAMKGNKIVCVTDDAYFGLVYEEGVARESIFAPLSNLHENVLVIKLDGPTKEDYVWGFRVGFITYAIKGGDEELYKPLEAKTAGAIRGSISNASNLSQSLLYSAYSDGDYDQEKEEKFQLLKTRYEAVKNALVEEKYLKYFKALPFNSGYFMCIQLEAGLSAEKVRQVLIEKYSIGTISLNNILRLAFSAVAASDIKEMFDGIYKACEECSSN